MSRKCFTSSFVLSLGRLLKCVVIGCPIVVLCPVCFPICSRFCLEPFILEAGKQPRLTWNAIITYPAVLCLIAFPVHFGCITFLSGHFTQDRSGVTFPPLFALSNYPPFTGPQAPLFLRFLALKVASFTSNFLYPWHPASIRLVL